MENKELVKTTVITKIDLGNGRTKYKDQNGEYQNFRSTIVLNRDIIERQENTHLIKIDGVGAVIGAKDGKTFAGERRYDRSDYLYTLLSTICLSHKDKVNINSDLLINLPLQLYQKDEYVEKLKSFEKIKDKEVKVDGVSYNVSISKVTPLPEGLLLNTLPEKAVENKRNVFLDFGYGTLDIIIAFGYEIEQIKTVKYGISLLYDAIAKKLNSNRETVEYYYNMPEKAIINCEEIDITDVTAACLKEYSDDVLNIIEDLAGGDLGGIYKFYFQGGGSEVIYDDFVQYVKNHTEKVEDAIYSNLRIFESFVQQEEQEKQEQQIQAEKEADKKSLEEKEAILMAEIKAEEEEKLRIQKETKERQEKLEAQIQAEEDEKRRIEEENKKIEEMKEKAAAEKAKKEAEEMKAKEAEEKRIKELEEKLRIAREEKAKAEEKKKQLEKEKEER